MFDRYYIVSLSGQPVARDRVQYWQYETSDGEAEVTSLNYFQEFRPSIKVGDFINVIHTDEAHTQVYDRYQLMVVSDCNVAGSRKEAVNVVKVNDKSQTRAVDIGELTNARTEVVDFGKEVTLERVALVLLGDLTEEGTCTVTVTADGKTLGTATFPAGSRFGEMINVTFEEGVALTGSAFTLSTTAVANASGFIRALLLA